MEVTIEEQVRRCNQLVIDSRLYKDEIDVVTEIGRAVKLLAKNGYDMIITVECDRFYIIEYNVRDKFIGDPIPVWLPQTDPEALNIPDGSSIQPCTDWIE